MKPSPFPSPSPFPFPFPSPSPSPSRFAKLRGPRRAALHLAAVAVLLPLLMPTAARAQATERESLETLRQTTLALIEALVQAGSLTRAKADALLADAKAKAAAATTATAAAAAPPIPEGATVTRVPYVPKVVRDQILAEVREEVLAQAKVERWGVPNATAQWTDRITIEGDVRLRAQGDRPDNDNPTPQDFLVASLAGVTRAPDFALGNSQGIPLGSTRDERERLRLRARLGVLAKVNDAVLVGLRLATGSETDRVSTNQTLGQNFNRYTFLLDRAYVQYDPAPWLSFSGGRIPNPWFSTELVWNDNLNFEGLAATFRWPALHTDTFKPYATVGYFPVREDTPGRRSRAIYGAQAGLQWEASERTRIKFGVAQYVYQGFEGKVDDDYDIVSGPGRSYGQYEYGPGLRQRGNTLFLTNNPLELQAGLTPDRARWGLAAKFRPVTLTAAAEFSHFAPFFIGLSGEFVRNQAYERAEIVRRAGVFLDDARVFGVGVAGTLGSYRVRNRGDWQVNLGYRWLGSDAVPDAFVDSDLGNGGTNLRGLSIGGLYGLATDTSVALRYLSARTISSPTVRPNSRDRYAIDSLRVDLNVRF